MGAYASDETDIMATYTRWLDAMVAKDIPALESVMEPSSTVRHMTGKVQSRAEYTGEIQDGILNYFGYEILDPEITTNGDTAHMKARTKLNARVYGASGTWTLRSGIDFKKSDAGTWHIADFDAAAF